MREGSSTRGIVGVRELRQNLSVYLQRVRQGETFRVTDRGEAVAMLRPLPEREDAYARLVAEGRVMPPAQARGTHTIEAPLPSRSGRPASEILDEVREDTI